MIAAPVVTPDLLGWLTPGEQAEFDEVVSGWQGADDGPRDSLAAYVHATFPGAYDQARHHAVIIDALEAVERGDIDRLMIFAPPQRGKSELVSVRFPAWVHGRHPDWGVMAFSHTASLAEDFSGQVRDQIGGDGWPFPDVQLKRGQAGVREWRLEGQRGRHFAAGVNGGGTGKGATLAIIDDPFKDDKDSGSQLVRERVYQWYWKVVVTRMAAGGRIVLMHTRWHEDDLAGRLLRDMANGGDQWHVLELREVAEPGEVDPLGRQPGEAIWPNRFPLSATKTIRETQPYVWHPLYQQRPGAARGGMLRREWFSERYNPAALPQFRRVVQTVDSAFSVEVGADPSAIATWGVTATHLYLLDYWCERVEYPDLLAGIKDQYAKWAHLSPWVFIENKASGQSAIQTLRRETIIPATGYDPGSASKVSRVQDAAPFLGSGRVLLPDGAPWLAAWIDEHVGFPRAQHDEGPDTTAMAVKVLGRLVDMRGEDMESEILFA